MKITEKILIAFAVLSISLFGIACYETYNDKNGSSIVVVDGAGMRPLASPGGNALASPGYWTATSTGVQLNEPYDALYVDGVAVGGGGGGSQTPWTEDIDGAGYSLTGVDQLGIATTTPQYQFDIASTTDVGYLGITNPATGDPGDIFRINEDGKVGINNNSSNWYLEVKGTSGIAKFQSTSAGVSAVMELNDAGGGDGRALDIACRRSGGQCLRLYYPQSHGAPGIVISGGTGDGIQISKSSGFSNDLIETKVDNNEVFVVDETGQMVSTSSCITLSSPDNSASQCCVDNSDAWSCTGL